MDRFPVLNKLASWPTLVGAGIGAAIVCFLVYPPHAGWGSDAKWGDVGGWIGAIATASATAVALAFGMGEMYRQRRDQRMRGLVALAMQVPEISRLIALFDAVESHYDALKNPQSNRQHHVAMLEKLAPAFKTKLTKHRVADFVDMPESLGYNLPAVIHSLPAVVCYAVQMKVRVRSLWEPNTPDDDDFESYSAKVVAERVRRESEFVRHVTEALDYTHSCSIDFRAAFAYAEEHIMPLQMKNMAAMLPERF